MRKWFIHRIDARNSPNNYVLAAGGVVWRRNEKGDIEVLLEHRKRYDDWSIPYQATAKRLCTTGLRRLLVENSTSIAKWTALRGLHFPKLNNRFNMSLIAKSYAVSGK